MLPIELCGQLSRRALRKTMLSYSPSFLATLAIQRGSIRTLLLICLLLIVGNVMSAGWEVALKSEFGALELASFVCLSIAAFMAASLYKRGLLRLWAVPYVFAFLALREMDFQDWWFDPGLLRAEIFTAAVPLWHKLVSAGAMGIIATTLISFFSIGARPFFSGLLRHELWAVTLIIGGGMVASALLLDGFERNLALFDITLSPTVMGVASYLEEVMEFGFAFSSVAALVLFARGVAERDLVNAGSVSFLH
ncbi:MAG: hypothetical protein JXQ85_08160 [Cognatishimia sp.]